MKRREPLQMGDKLYLKFVDTDGGLYSKTVEIEGQIERGEGSTCIVYEGRTLDDEMPVIVKEFYPISTEGLFDIERNPDKSLTISSYTKDNSEYQGREAQFLKCSEKQKNLSADSSTREIMVRYRGCCEYGDSHYILSEIHNGKALRLEEFKTLEEKLDIMIMIADVVNILHSKDYLFIDLSPQNLLWIKESEHVKSIKLFDVDSILDLKDLDNVHRSDIYLNSKYASPQMCKLLNCNAADFDNKKEVYLDKSMNIYNLGVLFFELLFERFPEKAELNFGVDTVCRLENELHEKYEESLYNLGEISSKIMYILEISLAKGRMERYDLTSEKLLGYLKEIQKKISIAPEIYKEKKSIASANYVTLKNSMNSKCRVIAFDEMGEFERRNSGIRFVGGYWGDFSNVDEEEEKIEKFLIHICEDFNQNQIHDNKLIKVIYPDSLHNSGNVFFKEEMIKNTVIKEADMVPLSEKERKNYHNLEKQFKKYVEEQVIQYLTEKNYQLFAFIDPYVNEGYKEMNMTNSNIVDVNKGTNLYERMAILTLYNHVFYSLAQDVQKYRFELPTRTLNGAKDEWGYEVYQNNKGEIKRTITNKSTYKTAISVMLFEKSKELNKLNTDYVFNVGSINYNNKAKKNTPFLYIADIVCSYIRRQFQTEFGINNETRENKIESKALSKLCKIYKIDVRVYDACEVIFKQMIENVKEAAIGEYYAKRYELEKINTPYREFYLDYWVPRLEDYFCTLLSGQKEYKKKFQELIPEYLTYTERFMGKWEINYEKGLYIAENLEKSIKTLNDYRNRNTVLFDIYDIILRGYNHRGSLGKTKEYIEKCEIYKNYVGIVKYIEHVLRAMQFYFNGMSYNEALEFGLRFEKTVKQLKKAYLACYDASNMIAESILENNNSNRGLQFAFAGKIYSSIGQAYGFLENYPLGKKYFNMALKEFDKNSGDYEITMSYFLHFLISNKKKSEYELHAVNYFGSINLWEQMENAFSATDRGYKLFVFVKAFYSFYADDRANNNILTELLSYVQKGVLDMAHPWELIYRNLYECLRKQSQDFDIKEYLYIKTKAMTCVSETDFTLKLIQIHARLIYMQREDKEFENYFVVDCLDEQELIICKQVLDNIREMTLLELKEWLDKKMTYMYN